MQLSEDKLDSEYIIQSYEPGLIKINGHTYTQSLIISPNELITNWRPQDFSALDTTAIHQLIKLKPQIVLLGTGSQQAFLKPALQALFYEARIGLEVMNTQAACRTWTILIAEGRKVVAGLFL